MTSNCARFSIQIALLLFTVTGCRSLNTDDWFEKSQTTSAPAGRRPPAGHQAEAEPEPEAEAEQPAKRDCIPDGQPETGGKCCGSTAHYDGKIRICGGV